MVRNLAVTAVTAILSIGAGQAQETDRTNYPSRPIRFIVPFAVGGGTDALSRIVGQVIQDQLGGTVVVENVGGAGGTIGTGQGAKAAPDGHTILSATPSITINPHIQKNVTYDVVRDFVPVVQVTTSPIVLVANKDFPIRTVRDLIEMARARPGSISYGSAGTGSAAYLSAELFKALAGIDLTHVPYRGTGPALIDLIAGRIQVEFEDAPGVLGQIRSGELKAIAVGTAKKSIILPDLPLIAESVSSYESSSWFGILAPAGTPQPIIEKLNAAINRGLGNPAIQKRLIDLGVEQVGGTPEEFGAYLKIKVAEADRVAKAAGLKPE